MPISRIKAETVLICSDLHLSPKNMPVTNFFCEWIIKYCGRNDLKDNPQWLLILGDLFDHWVGDDLIYSEKRYSFEKDNDSIYGVKPIGTSRFIEYKEASMSSE